MDELFTKRPLSSEMSLIHQYTLSPSKTLKRDYVAECEYFVLSELATRLSSYVASRPYSSSLDSHSVNQTSEIIDKFSVEEDAELLIRFMSSSPVLESLEVIKKSAEKVISPSLSFETNHLCWVEPESLKNDLQSEPRKSNHTTDIKTKQYAFSNGHCGKIIRVTYPCLSLSSGDSMGQSSSNLCLPTSLLSRQAQVTDKPCSEAIKHVADQLALNAMTSFKQAMEWRAKVWISKLIRCRKYRSPQLSFHLDRTTSMVSSDLEVESSDVKLIRALLRTLSSVTVSDVRTTIEVLEKQGLTCDDMISHEHYGDSYGEYKLSHAVNMEFTFTICNRNDVSLLNRMSISLRTPGVIHGSFRRSFEDDFPLSLSSVDFILDTSALSHGLERHSRHIVRSFTEEYILSCHPALYPCNPPTMTKSEPQIKEVIVPATETGIFASIEECDDNSVKSSLDERSDESLIATSKELYNFTIVTPHEVHENLESTNPSHSIPVTLSVHSVLEQSNPNKKQRLSPAKYLHPRRVSPNIFKSDSSSDSLKDNSVATTSSAETGKIESFQSQIIPSIISPTPVRENTSMNNTIVVNNGPLLPSLSEMICGADQDEF